MTCPVLSRRVVHRLYASLCVPALAAALFCGPVGCLSAEDSVDEEIGTSEEALSALDLALGKPAAQSSTYSTDAVAGAAVDGNTNGNFGNHSVTHTNTEVQPWWRVDLGSSQVLSSVVLWNRTDCCSDRLSNFVVEVSDDLSVWRTAASYPGIAPTSLTLQLSDPGMPAGAHGRYLRVRLLGTGILSLAEVQVFGSLAQGKVATQSSVYAGGDPSRAIDGNTDGAYGSGSTTHTGFDEKAWWQVDLGSVQGVGSVVLWNRTDCCSERLANFTVRLSRDGQSWTDYPYPGTAGRTVTFNVNQAARFVKVQLNFGGYLSLAEVQVMPAPPQSGFARVSDLSGGVPGSVQYQQYWGDSGMLTGWLDNSDTRFVGDFMGLGHDQAFYVNRSGSDGKLMIVDYAGVPSPGSVKYFESWGQNDLLGGWLDAGDRQLTGDFMGLGHSQEMFINRGGSGGKFMVVDYAGGVVPGVAKYWEGWGQSSLLDGWLDNNDFTLAGDFMGLGHSQVMYINRGGSGGKIMVVDYAGGVAPGSVRYFESWGQSALLNGWIDDNDLLMVGDFMGLGHSQLMFINRGGSDGKVMIVDYAGGSAPGAVQYLEIWGQNGLLGGWLDSGDGQVAGDFMGLGHSQVLFRNAQNNGDGKLLVMDYSTGALGGTIRYIEGWQQSGSLDGYIAEGDPSLIGDFTGAHHTQLLSFNLASPPETGIVSSP